MSPTSRQKWSLRGSFSRFRFCIQIKPARVGKLCLSPECLWNSILTLGLPVMGERGETLLMIASAIFRQDETAFLVLHSEL